MINYNDSYKHKGWRRNLIQELREKNIASEQVLEAMNHVPRHFFVEPAFEHHAYEDRAFPILKDQTLSQPSTVAYQSTLLNVQPNDKILEVGTGSAYQATILAQLKAKVFTIERHLELFKFVEKTYPFKNVYPTLKFFYGDGFEGLPTFAPFDKIIITAGAPFVPQKLLDQLVIGGIIIIPLNTENENKQIMKKIKKISSTEFEEEVFGEFTFVPMLAGRQAK